MIYKLNEESTKKTLAGECDVSYETSGGKEPLDINNLKAEVSNYIEVMTDIFGVPENIFLETIPINISHVKTFIKNNPNVAGLRIYLAKKTNSASVTDDYELLFVPCTEENDDKNRVYYRDNLGVNGIDSFVVALSCRKPPDCKMGALLLP